MNANAANSSTETRMTLVVFCRRPAPGIGQQRIAADLGEATTFTLTRHLLATTLEDAAAWPGPVIVAPADAADAEWAGALLTRPFDVLPQPVGNLGERICAVDHAARAAGHAHLIYIGSDAPTLTDAYFARARTTLAACDVVLGPADDGGVTLMGAACPWPDLAALPWSSAELAGALELLCTRQGLTVKRLESRYDIDRVDNLPRLRTDLRDDPRPARRELLRWLDAEGLRQARS
jgi:hypothetical protein